MILKNQVHFKNCVKSTHTSHVHLLSYLLPVLKGQ